MTKDEYKAKYGAHDFVEYRDNNQNDKEQVKKEKKLVRVEISPFKLLKIKVNRALKEIFQYYSPEETEKVSVRR